MFQVARLAGGKLPSPIVHAKESQDWFTSEEGRPARLRWLHIVEDSALTNGGHHVGKGDWRRPYLQLVCVLSLTPDLAHWGKFRVRWPSPGRILRYFYRGLTNQPQKREGGHQLPRKSRGPLWRAQGPLPAPISYLPRVRFEGEMCFQARCFYGFAALCCCGSCPEGKFGLGQWRWDALVVCENSDWRGYYNGEGLPSVRAA